VDYETDHHIQETIATEFNDRTILCIARQSNRARMLTLSLVTILLDRLRTIISYDRICVMDAGRIAEIDSPTNLYKRTDSIFRGMCDRSGITLDDIRLAAKRRTEWNDTNIAM
jgi:ABC-type multidrug transport system fused ATPase/permease subunit